MAQPLWQNMSVSYKVKQKPYWPSSPIPVGNDPKEMKTYVHHALSMNIQRALF